MNSKPSFQPTHSTRSVTSHWYFGPLQRCLSEIQLPTKSDVISVYFYLRFEKFGSKRNLTRSEKLQLCKDVIPMVTSIWNKAHTPIMDQRNIESYMIYLIDSMNKFIENNVKKKANKEWIIESKRTNFDVLFDISKCRCFKNATKKEQLDLSLCKCEAKRDPKFVTEFEFFSDQKLERNRFISASKDIKTSIKYQKRDARESLESSRLAKKIERQNTQSQNETFEPDSIGAAALPIENDSFEPEQPESESNYKQPNTSHGLRNTHDISPYVSLAQRYGVSDRAASGLAQALMKSYNIEDPSFYPSTRKIRETRNNLCEKLSKEHSLTSNLICISFDGKCSNILQPKSKIVKEDIITVTFEPGGQYLDHFVPENARGFTLGEYLFHILNMYNSEESLSAALADGTGSNTSPDVGAIFTLETLLERPLSWLVCMLHFNELPLKHIEDKYVGKTAGPEMRKGDLGQKVYKINKNLCKMVDFKTIPGKVPSIEEVAPFLANKDQKYLFDFAWAISNEKGREFLLEKYGEIPDGPGQPHNARWLKTASCYCRSYVQEESPSEEHIRVIHVILNLYVPMFFQIKKNPSVVDGAKNFFKAIELARETLNDTEKEIVYKVFANNSYMCHHEMILLSMVFDDSMLIRHRAVWIIVNARKYRANKKLPPRKYSKPSLDQINLKAKSYVELQRDIWHYTRFRSHWTEPPLLRNISNAMLIQGISKKLELPEITQIPCHSQNTERSVQNTALASSRSIGQEKVHGNLLNLGISRTNVPTEHSKSTFLN